MDAFELILVVFDNTQQARLMLDDLLSEKKLHASNEAGNPLFDAAVLVKDANGKTHIKETHDLSAGRGALVGAIAGGVVGLLGGPVGVVVGAAAGAATGGAAAGRLDLGFSNRFLSELKTSMRPGSSLLLTIVEEAYTDQVLLVLEKHPGKVLRHVVRGEAVEQLARLQNQD